MLGWEFQLRWKKKPKPSLPQFLQLATGALTVDAMRAIATTRVAPADQKPSIGCSIKWRTNKAEPCPKRATGFARWLLFWWPQRVSLEQHFLQKMVVFSFGLARSNGDPKIRGVA